MTIRQRTTRAIPKSRGDQRQIAEPQNGRTATAAGARLIDPKDAGKLDISVDVGYNVAH
jgi:hypothetical protein